MSLLSDLKGPLLGTVVSVVLFVVLALVGVGFVVWGIYRVAKGVVDTDSRWIRNERVATLASYVEREIDVARQFDLADRLEPTEQERRERERERLEEQYVAGELSEREFERRLEELLDDGENREPELSTERS